MFVLPAWYTSNRALCIPNRKNILIHVVIIIINDGIMILKGYLSIIYYLLLAIYFISRSKKQKSTKTNVFRNT